MFKIGDLVDIVFPHLYALADSQSVGVVLKKHTEWGKTIGYEIRIYQGHGGIYILSNTKKNIASQHLIKHESSLIPSTVVNGTKWWT